VPATKNCLVIGANGFIGSHLVDSLVSAGYSVRAFDRFSNEPQFKSSDKIEIFKGDFFDDIAVAHALTGIDYLFHSFSATTPYVSDSDPYKDINLNVMRNIQLFEKAVEKGVRKVVYLSSGGAVYGHLAEQKSVTEEDVPKPVSPYGIGKLASEYYLEYFNRKYGLDYVVYRVTNPYGPRQVTKNNQGVIPAFLEKIEDGQKLTVIGDGTSTRDYIYITDATDMIVKSSVSPTDYQIYNLGSGTQTSVNEIIDTLRSALGVEVKVEYVDAPKTFLTKSQISIDRFSNEFGLRSSTSLKSGVKLFLSQK
jgi:UDP-glucose 4-epimerase